MSENTTDTSTETPWWKKALDELPIGDLKSDATDYVKALAEKGTSGLTDKLNDFAQSMTPDADGAAGEGLKKGAEKLSEGKNPASAGAAALAEGAKDKLTPGSGGDSGGGSSDVKKFSNIVESIDVGVPIKVAYNQWTQFQDWTDFMKKVENAEQQSDEKLKFKGQVFLSHRSWESTIVQQVPDEQIVWESSGEKGHLDGAVTFHELGPRLTRILIIVNYYPQGFVEKVGNMGRPVGRRIRVESRLFARYVMTHTILDEDSVEGWRGEIRDREVVRTHEEALEAEQAEQDEAAEQEDAQQPEESAGSDESSEEEPASDEDTASDEGTEPEDDDEQPEEGDEEPDDQAESEDAEPEEDAAAADEEPAEDETAEPDDDFEYVEEESETTGGSS